MHFLEGLTEARVAVPSGSILDIKKSEGEPPRTSLGQAYTWRVLGLSLSVISSVAVELPSPYSVSQLWWFE